MHQCLSSLNDNEMVGHLSVCPAQSGNGLSTLRQKALFKKELLVQSGTLSLLLISLSRVLTESRDTCPYEYTVKWNLEHFSLQLHRVHTDPVIGSVIF